MTGFFFFFFFSSRRRHTRLTCVWSSDVCSSDLIGRESLSTLFEAEIPSVIYAVFEEMAIGAFRIRINNRKVLKGILRHFDVPEDRSAEVLRALDKIDKEDERTILAELEAQGLAAKAARELYGVIGAK